jgi:hypothetical protein
MSHNTPTDTNGVGYQKPPQQSRFRKGVSGNPKGRPRKSAADRQFEDIVSKALDVALNEVREVATISGPTKLSRRQVMVRKLVEGAADGDMRSIKRVFKLRERIREEPALNPVVIEMDDGDFAVCGAENMPAIRARMEAARKERVATQGTGGLASRCLSTRNYFVASPIRSGEGPSR